MIIRKYSEKDKERVKEICLANADLDSAETGDVKDFILLMFCLYYIENEPENCFVAVDENDIPFGYVYGTTDFQKYKIGIKDYLNRIKNLQNKEYYEDALTEIADHEKHSELYPAHLHIDVLNGFRGSNAGTALITAFCNNLNDNGIVGVMLIVGEDNVRGRHFYENNGFTLLGEKPSGAEYGKLLN